jgi:hypothetical protein
MQECATVCGYNAELFGDANLEDAALALHCMATVMATINLRLLVPTEGARKVIAKLIELDIFPCIRLNGMQVSYAP